MPTASVKTPSRRSRLQPVDHTPHYRKGRTATLALQRGWRRVKEWYTESYPTCDTGEHEPSWVSARRANLADCRFYRLPDELILQILGSLDDVSKALAMRACGLFLRLMFDRTLFPRTLGFRSSLESRTWPPSMQFVLNMSRMSFEFGPELASLRKEVDLVLDRDRFCDPCRQFREDGRYETAMQALEDTLWCSRCGDVHKRPLFSPRQRDAPSATRVCVLAEGKAHFCAHLSIGLDSPQTLPSARDRPCRHPDHEPPWYIRLEESITNHENNAYKRPYLRSFPPRSDTSLNLISDTTLFLSRLHHGVPVTRAWLREILAAKAHVLDKMLCPHVTACDGQLLLPFGPDRCACFDCPRWIDHSCSSDPHSCCRCHCAETAGLAAGYFIPGEINWRHKYNCVICRASYEWLRHGSAVYLRIGTLRLMQNPTLPVQPRSYPQRSIHWLYQLHPDSWGILDDEELHHVAWCDDIHCMTRWRWERLSRLLG